MTNILEYLENTASLDKIAFKGENDSLSFRELSTLARRIGSFFTKRGIYKQPIPVIMSKSPRMIAAFFGVVYSANYYVPIDSSMPDAKIKAILNTVNPPIIICDDSLKSRELGYSTCEFSEISAHDINDDALEKIRCHSIDVDPVYVVFTSGSTGIPKGVVASHRAVIDYVDALCPVLNANENTVFGNQSPLYLDACLKEIFPTLKYGAKTVIIPPSLFAFPVKLVEFIAENEINTICWVASALSMVAGLGLFDSDKFSHLLKSLNVIAFGSEVFPAKHLARWRNALPQAKFVHLYGPTETTGMATFYVIDRDFAPDEKIPIGKPFLNREIILLDDNGKIPNSGQTGEIYIRGSQLSLGYFSDETRTKAAFVQNPLSPFPDILYKTGDLAYQNSDGNFVFIARRDHQIKHMGYRIELTEIEAAARRLQGIEMACAIFDNQKSRISLFYTTANEHPLGKGVTPPNQANNLIGGVIENAQLRTHLKSELPRHMLPHEINKLDTMPLTPGGKIDRTSLACRSEEVLARRALPD